MMNSILLIVVGVIYVVVGINYYMSGQSGLAITFIAYALANYGLYLTGAQ